MLEDYKVQGKDSAEKVEMLSNSIKGLELKINNLKAKMKILKVRLTD